MGSAQGLSELSLGQPERGRGLGRDQGGMNQGPEWWVRAWAREGLRPESELGQSRGRGKDLSLGQGRDGPRPGPETEPGQGWYLWLGQDMDEIGASARFRTRTGPEPDGALRSGQGPGRRLSLSQWSGGART